MVSEKLKFTTKLAYGSGDLAAAITANVLVFFLLYFFTNVAGLPAGLASLVLAIGKISDAINDPITGVLSDRTRTRWGRRIPWIFWGAIPFGLIYFFQWLVPHFSDNPGVNTWLLFSYYVAIGVIFNLAYTAVNLPYTALTPELTQNYNERTALNSFRMAFSIGGSILSLVLAQVIFGFYPNNPQAQYWVLGLICSLISVISIFWCVFRIQERGAQPLLRLGIRKKLGWVLLGVGSLGSLGGLISIVLGKGNLFSLSGLLLGLMIGVAGVTWIDSEPEPYLVDRAATQAREVSQSTPDIPLGEQFAIVFSNKPFLYVIGIYLCSWLGVQLTASILIYFVVSWMGIGEAGFPQVAIAVQGTALVMLFVWQKISDKLGKKTVYFMGTVLWIIAQAGLFLLQPGQISLMYALAILAGFGVSVAYLIPWSMVPDIIELDELQTGQRREGIFYGFMVLLQKIGLALALFLVGIALESSGFIERMPGAAIPVQPESALLAIRIAIGPLPTLFLIAGLVLAYFYPITQEFHQNILLQLAERKQEQE